ncbi:MAG: gamma-glutamylcyclotransferase [Rhodospirillaceae bacterium]
MPAAPVTPAAFASSLPAGADLWVFAYGSLMWDPGFPFLETRRGLLRGYHRRFCIYSTYYRGTPEQPGLVFGLDHGGACRGIVFRVAAKERDAVLDALWTREMVTAVYRPKLLPVRCEDGTLVSACAFTVDRAHAQYCRGLSLSESAALIRRGVGGRGPNLEYLANTVKHLELLGIVDHGLRELLKAASSEPV